MDKVKMQLVGQDRNAFSILGRFSREAQRAGWNEAEIKKVTKEAMSGDYNHLLATIMNHVEEPDFDEDEAYGEDEDE